MFSFSALAQSSGALSPFTTDGCSMFPDALPILEKDWKECCFDHDVAYWLGGTEEQRKSADLELSQCVATKAGKPLGFIMYAGVRAGGQYWLPTEFRWGYGWEEHRGYLPLTLEELLAAEQLGYPDFPYLE